MSESRKPEVSKMTSVVIPTLGRELLKGCLASILHGRLLPNAIIVVDQSANDEIRNWLSPLAEAGVQVRHIPSQETGRARGVNRGIEAVTTPFFAITDDDCTVDVDWLQCAETMLRSEPNSVVTGRVEGDSDDAAGILVTSTQFARYEHPRLKYDSLCGGNMATSRELVGRVGLFDEDDVLRCSEDGEWAYRALRSGATILYTPNMVVQHLDWRSGEERAEQYASYARSHGAFYGKYLRRADWFIAARAIAHLLRAGRRYLRGMANADPQEMLIGRAYLCGLIPGILAGFRNADLSAPISLARHAGA
jgi:GT2 family glycosyltransferase